MKTIGSPFFVVSCLRPPTIPATVTTSPSRRRPGGGPGAHPRPAPADAAPDRPGRPARAVRADDGPRRAAADVLDRVEAEADLALDDGEVRHGGVHVRRQHLDPELVASVDVV